jgi:hypothetical protein
MTWRFIVTSLKIIASCNFSYSQQPGRVRTVGAVGTIENSAVVGQEKIGYNAFNNTEEILWINSFTDLLEESVGWTHRQKIANK